MCFNEPVSWLALAVGLVGCHRLNSQGTPASQALAVFFAVVVAMQLWEALLWRSLRSPSGGKDANMALSRAAMVNNHLEPLALLLACRRLLPGGDRDGLAGAMGALYLAAALPYSARFWRSRQTTDVGPGGGLEWKWNQGPGYGLVYGLFCASAAVTAAVYLPGQLAVTAPALVVLSYAVSCLVYRPAMAGSMWCFTAAGMPFLF